VVHSGLPGGPWQFQKKAKIVSDPEEMKNKTIHVCAKIACWLIFMRK
jgi:hypothetical protein